MRLVVVGETNSGSRTPQRVRALRDLDHDVAVVSTTPPGWTYENRPGLVERFRYRLRLPADPAEANQQLLKAVLAGCDLVILDNARMIRPAVLRRVKSLSPRVRLVWYSEDDMKNPRHRSRWMDGTLSLIDLWVTTKSFNVPELAAMGVRRPYFVDNSFDPVVHRPIALSGDERAAFGSQVSFVGTFEAQRASDLLALANSGIQVRVWGNGWEKRVPGHVNLTVENRPAYGDDYRRVTCASAINLCFLRKGNRDLQTCRSMEIPAMGGFMMHEFNEEIVKLFAPDKEAVYFRAPDELVDRCRFWLENGGRRGEIAAAGTDRVHAEGHSHQDCWAAIIGAALEAK